MRFLIPLAMIAAAVAADPLADFRSAFSKEGFDEKRSAISAVAALPKDRDAEVYPLLLMAADDRQGGALALSALAARSGTSQADAAGWKAWWAAEQAKRAQDDKIKALEKKVQESTASKTPKEGEPPSLFEEQPAPAQPAKPAGPTQALPDDVGLLDRVRFKAGGSLVCYVRTVRRDEQNRIVSVRIVHKDGGEETLDGKLIDTIEEDIR